MRFKDLSRLKKRSPMKIVTGTLPDRILMTEHALDKAFKLNELVRAAFEKSYEWYGYTLADPQRPELIVDIGLPQNAMNLPDYTVLGAGDIARFQEALPDDRMINGWIHSHGDLKFHHFSRTDQENSRRVLDFLAMRTKRPVAKEEIVVRDLVLLEKDRYRHSDLERGSVALITDAVVQEVRILETVYGSFCYSIVVGDGGWHVQEVHHRERAILSGASSEKSLPCEIELMDTPGKLGAREIQELADQVKRRIQPRTDPFPERAERL